ncbi:hypothetical protein [Sphingomonas baiyangensis]|uniref:Uncharacterized protein n=1 Tax=Sphingomonas baiyangensis TaxID=2572576 RepID=A0A4U1L5X7_9SPHN|nr:hypothetical protein [Sphingomonas baiyangensis]TKD51713.1 hypothetical protein FBR43_13815 [Sphingomonas baiyangensis]
MANVDGNWDTVVKSPMGDQKATLNVQSNGDSFTGNFAGGMGTSDVTGSVDGDTLKWKMDITVPMPMTLDCEATVDGDTLSGKVTAGAFGSFPLEGTRA